MKLLYNDFYIVKVFFKLFFFSFVSLGGKINNFKLG